MRFLLWFLLPLVYYVQSIDFYADERLYINENPLASQLLEIEEPEPLTKGKEKVVVSPNLDCENFQVYTTNCTNQAALMYNYSRRTPPKPDRLLDWCSAIKSLTNCAIDWNTDCRDVTNDRYNDENIKGLIHVIDNICDDFEFLLHYRLVSECVESIMYEWEICYTNFKSVVDYHKSSTNVWTHYETHFLLCCSRTQFRKCTFEHLFERTNKLCNRKQSTTLQRFSVIISEGDVHQNCDRNVMYENCPGGDPRPSSEYLSSFLRPADSAASSYCQNCHFFMCTLQIVFLILLFILQ